MLDHADLFSYTEQDLWADPAQTHVWRISLDLDAARLAALETSLSPEERTRAARFHAPTDRDRFIVARGSLRAILGQSLGVEPGQVPLDYAPGGKPLLAGSQTLHFNLSHSDSLALLAVSPRRAVGVDLERLRTDFEPETLANRFFAPSECAALSRVSAGEKHTAFLRLWTLKEAYLKAVGTGLNFPLNQFAVSLDDLTISPAAPYRLQSLDPAPGYVAALAVALDAEG